MYQPPPILDTMILQAFVFGHERGVEILLQALGRNRARFPAEVYNADEDRSHISTEDVSLSEFARGIRWARRQLHSAPPPKARRCQRWLDNLQQQARFMQAGALSVDPLSVLELPERDAVSRRFGLGRGESACLVLAQRPGGLAVFVSSDEAACSAAASLSIRYRTVPDLLKTWVRQHRPDPQLLAELLDGMSNARFTLKQEDADILRNIG